MKKLFVTALLMTVFAGGMFAADMKIESLTWFDFMNEFDSSFNMTDGGNFSISRSYLTVKATISEKVSARVTYDFAKNSAGSIDGYFKFAYVNWALLDNTSLMIGTVPLAAGPAWTYEIPILPLNGMVRTSSSADLGLSVKQTLMSDKLAIVCQIINGEGYTAWSSSGIDQNYAAILDVNLQYAETGAFNVAFRYDEADATMDWSLDAFLDQKVGDLGIFAEFIGYSASSTFSYAVRGMFSYDLNDALKAVALVDYYNDLATAYLSMKYVIPGTKIAIKPLAGATFDTSIDYLLGIRTDINFGYTVFED